MLLTLEQIQALSKTGDVFRYAVVGFSAVETALEELLIESLVTSHGVELSRLSVELKLDLAIGLGVIGRKSKPLMMKLSKVRNFYAHEFAVDAEYCPVAELKSCFSPRQRLLAGKYFAAADTFREGLRVAFITAYYDVVGAIDGLKKRKKDRAAALLHAEAVLSVTTEEIGLFSAPTEAETSARLDALIEQRKQEIIAKQKAHTIPPNQPEPTADLGC